MALEIIPNQPVKFTRIGDVSEVPCPNCCPDDFCTPVRPGDYTQFQFKVQPCADEENSILDGGFDDINCENWNVFPAETTTFCNFLGQTSNLIIQSNVSTSLILQQTGVLEVGCYYEFKFLASQSGSDNGVQIQSASLGIGNTSDVYIQSTFGSDLFEGYSEFTLYGYAQTTDFDLTFLAENLLTTIAIDSIEVKKIDLNYSVAICDDDGNIYSRLDVATDLNNQDEGFQFVSLQEDRITVTVDWSAQALQFGCYCICLFDPCAIDASDFNNLINSEFDNAFGWSIINGGSTSIATSLLRINRPLTGMQVKNDFVLELGQEYNVLLDVFSEVNCAHQIQLTFQGQTSVINPSEGVTSYAVVGDGQPFCMDVDLVFVDTNPLCGEFPMLDITNISVENADGDQIPDYKSNCFNLKQDSCSVLIEGCNDSDGFGFLFNKDFVPNVRVFGVIKNPTYGINRSTFIDSKGKQVNSYYRREKQYNLLIEAQPEYILDFLSLLFGFDHVYVNGKEYVVVEGEEFTPVYDPNQDCLARVTFAIREKIDFVENVKCQEEGEGCIPRTIQAATDDGCDLDVIFDPNGNEGIQDPTDETFLLDL